MAGTLVLDNIKASSGVLATQNGMTGIAKAWVQFTGSSATINGSFNVSSITRNNTGYYTVNFTTAMPNANYSVSAQAGTNGSTMPTTFLFCDPVASTAQLTPTTTAFSFSSGNYTQTTRQEGGLCCVSVFSS